MVKVIELADPPEVSSCDNCHGYFDFDTMTIVWKYGTFSTNPENVPELLCPGCYKDWCPLEDKDEDEGPQD